MARFGPNKGWETPGTVKVGGDLTVAGVFTTGSTVVAGVITEDVLMAADKDIGAQAGSGNVVFGDMTGTFDTPTGANTINGDLAIASGKDINFVGGGSLCDLHLGGGIFKTTTGAVTIGPGAVGITGAITIAADKGIVLAAASTGDFDFSLSTGIFKTPTGKTTLGGHVDLAANMDIIAVGGTSKLDYHLASGIFKTSTGAVTIGPGAVGITGAITIAADKGIVLAGASTGDFDFVLSTGIFKTSTGANTLSGDVTITAGKKLTKGVTLERQLAKTATYPIEDTDPDIVVVGALSGHATITLPTLSANQGRIITVILGGDPGAFNVIVDGEGAELINGVATLTNSDQYSYLKMLGTPAEWLILARVGTWT